MNKHVKNGVKRMARLTDAFGLVALTFLYMKFFQVLGVNKINGIEAILTPFPVLLAMFTQSKAVKKVLGEYTSKRRGEIWVLLWFFTAVLMFVLWAIYPNKFVLPFSELMLIVPLVVTLGVQSYFNKLDS